MRRSQYTSKFFAVLVTSLLAVAFGSASKSTRHLQDPVHGMPAARAEKEPHETGGDLLSHVQSSGAASPKAEPVDAGDAVSLRSNALQFGPYADVNFPNQIPLPRYFPGYFDKHIYAAVREGEAKHVDRAGSQVKQPESGRRKRSADSRMKDNKGNNGDHPLPDEPGAKLFGSENTSLQERKKTPPQKPHPAWVPGFSTYTSKSCGGIREQVPCQCQSCTRNSTEMVHCWNEANVFDVVLPASEVAQHFPHECQHPLSCNTTCVAKVPGRDVCARLKSECTVPETHMATAQNENKQLASFEKNVERRLGELDAKLAQLSSESSQHKDKLVELGNNLNHFSDALKKQLSAASVKTLDSLDRKAAEMKTLFNEKSESMITAISSVSSLIQSDSKTHLWTLKGYAEQKANAMKNGWSWKRGQKVYIGRYLISWGIYFKSSPSGVTLHLNLQLHKGISDEFLEWPFSKELKLSILHPESGEKQEGRDKPDTSLKNFARPVEVSNGGVYYGAIKFESSHLESNGYVKNDQLLLKLEMLS